MKPICCFFLALAFFAAIPGMAAPTATSPPPSLVPLTRDAINWDKLVLTDLQCLPEDKIIKTDDQIWVLAQMILAPPKPAAWYGVEDPVTHKTTTFFTGDINPHARGQFVVQASLAKKTLPSEDYDLPVQTAWGGCTPESLFQYYNSPLRIGGYAICEVNPKAEGEERYSPLYVVPAEWQAFVVPAFAFCRANPTLFSDTDARMTAARRARLTALLTSPNPYLAAFACQALTRAAAVDAETIDVALAQPDPFRQAMMTYLLLANVPRQDNATATVVEGSIHAATNAADTLDDLNGIALGIGSALVTAGEPATWGARDDLAEARKRLAPDGAADSYISALLQGHERTDK